MDFDIIGWVIEFILGGIIGVLIFFLRRTMSELDSKVSKSEVEKLEKINEEQRLDIKNLNEKYATKAELAEIKNTMSKMQDDITYVRDNAIKKEDFYRVMSETNESIKSISNYIMRK